MQNNYDYVIIGAGIFGLYASLLLTNKGFHVLLIELDYGSSKRASYVNQARLHNGYHYPRSVETAMKTAEYYERFKRDFDFAINNKYKSIYAISSSYSYVNGDQFNKFTEDVGLYSKKIDPSLYFKAGVEAAFETEESSFDSMMIRKYFEEKLMEHTNVKIKYKFSINSVEVINDKFIIKGGEKGEIISSDNVINATYAGINHINELFGFNPMPLKYELTEVILVNVGTRLENTGITLMDGPFFSIMPFGLSGYHSLTSVVYTPHIESKNVLPQFRCQNSPLARCNPKHLDNCTECSARPSTTWPLMYQQVKKYLNFSKEIEYNKSLYTVKTVLASSELDDSRPTIISEINKKPRFITVFSGKYNTIYDLEKVIK